jgi:hypothetical protein
MAAVYVTNLVINSGADFSQSFTLEGTDNNSALNLTGYAVNAQFRKWSGSSTSVSFGTSITNPPTLGQIYLTLSSQNTSSPTSAVAMAFRICVDGIVTVSLRKSIIIVIQIYFYIIFI